MKLRRNAMSDRRPGQTLIVRRPRLTTLLDGAHARIVVFTAPAGYGKTTLAREWMAGKRFVWIPARAYSPDIASFGLVLAEAVEAIVPAAAEPLSTAPRTSFATAVARRASARLLARNLAQWPSDAWLVIDDYHWVSQEPAVDDFVDALVTLSPIHLLIATRERPRWVSARRVLYREIVEIGSRDLLMNDTEAADVLRDHPFETLTAYRRIAQGWPAVLGMAARARLIDPSGLVLASPLYDYLAEELFNDASDDIKVALTHFALASRVTNELAQRMFPATATALIAGALSRGFLESSGPGYTMHPLLRDFLRPRVACQRFRDGATYRRLLDLLHERALRRGVRSYPVFPRRRSVSHLSSRSVAVIAR